MSDDRIDIDAAFVARLVAAQFPQWAEFPVKPVEFSGWDNRTFRLGDDMSVRLPTAARYAPQVEKEHLWLSRLAPVLPLPIPVPLAMGAPADGYPWHWSVYRWIDGETATVDRIADLCQFATDLAGFLAALHRIDPGGGPAAGPHSFYRGGPLTVYDAETRRAIRSLAAAVDPGIASSVWEAALQATWHGPPVWVHGDVAATNLLVEDGRLSAVIDFGTSAVGDPACDTTIAWTLFSGRSREAFRSALRVDDATWARGRGWAIWKALITLADNVTTDRAKAEGARTIIHEVIADNQNGVR